MTSLQHHHPRTMEATTVEQSSANNMHGLSSLSVEDASSPAEVPATSTTAAPPPDSEIQRLSQDTIRRISAEQAISDLSSIVKELVDNALDAEATTIKIRLFQQGLRIIEVSDDGCGIAPSSLPFIATRHATSKITSIDDIYTGTGLTMGFRGEALFSMACVSNELVVATKTEDDELATKMVFGKDGLPIEDKTEQFPRKNGTTVAVVNPYSSLPARLADLTRRIRNERTRIYKLIEAYGIFNVGVSFQLIDIGDNGVGTTFLQTSANSQTLKETVSHLLTPTVLRTMQEVDISLDSMLERIYGENSFHWGITGLLSSEPTTQQASQQQPSSSSTRKFENRVVQFYSINGRVVELPKITDMLQKLWKAFGGKKRPRIILSLTLPNEAFDINLSPDKQTVLLTHEKELLGEIEEFVTNMWSNSASRTFEVSHTPGTQTEAEPRDTRELDAAAEDEGDQSGEEDDRYRQLHKRRFAFVHDLSKAKMQHDMEERQLRENFIHHGDEVGQERTTLLNNAEIEEEASQESPSKRPRHSLEPEEKPTAVFVIQNIPAAGSDDSPETAASANEVLKVSDGERRQWIEIQSNFRRSTSNESDGKGIKMQDVTVPDQTQADDEASNRVSPDKFMLPPSGHRPDRRTPVPTDAQPISFTTQRVVSTSTKQLRLTDLKKFAFQSSSSDAKSVRRNEVSDPDFSCSVPTTHESGHQGDERKRQVSLELSSQSPRTYDADDYGADITMKGKEGEEEEVAEEQPTSDERSDANDSSEIKLSNEISQQVVWSSFASTQQVCQSSRIERMRMIERRREISSISRNGSVASGHISSPQSGNNDAIHTNADDNDGNGENGANNQAPTSIRMSKSTFRNGMKVVGQFNLGFILAVCSQNQLWILDQHACDERTNFEHLCKKTIIHEQPLIKPLPLELSPAEEACVLDHMDIFRANGFRFVFDPEAPIRHRLSLNALPHSGAVDGQKAVQFGPSDVSSLCSILMEGSSYDAGDGGTGVDGSGLYGNNAVRRHASSVSRISQTQSETSTSQKESADSILARLPKAIAMFASRACRTSIMIGTALSQREMDTIVKKLAELDMPFTCAHGRPTMNHVGDISSIILQDERRTAEYIATPTITMVPLSQETEDE